MLVGAQRLMLAGVQPEHQSARRIQEALVFQIMQGMPLPSVVSVLTLLTVP